VVVLFLYTGSSLKPFVEPSSANTGNFSAGESSRAKDVFRPGPLPDGTMSPDPKTAVELDKPAEAISRKQRVSKKLLADVVGDKKDAPVTCSPQNVEDAPTKSQDTTRPPAADDLENSGEFREQGQRWRTTRSTSSQGPADSNFGTDSTLNETGLEFDSSKKVSNVEAQSTEEVVPMESKMTRKKPGVLRNSVSHQVGSAKTSGPLESESQCLQDSAEEVQRASRKGTKSKEKEAKGVKGSASDEFFQAKYEKWKTRLGGTVNTKEDPQATPKRKEDAISSTEKEKLVKSKKKKV
jgi:hypothetical protein